MRRWVMDCIPACGALIVAVRASGAMDEAQAAYDHERDAHEAAVMLGHVSQPVAWNGGHGRPKLLLAQLTAEGRTYFPEFAEPAWMGEGKIVGWSEEGR